MESRTMTRLVTLCLIGVLSGCASRKVDNPTFAPVYVVHPDPNDVTNDPGWSKDADGHMVVHIEFSRDVDKNTVVQGTTLILTTPKQPSTEGTYVWKSDHELDYVTSQTYAWLVPQPSYDTVVTLELHGTPGPYISTVIKDKSGHALDGDNDGTEGGNYKRRLVIAVF